MKTRRKILLLLTSSVLSIAVWYRFSYPQFAFVNLSVSRTTALRLAQDYLRTDLHVDPDAFRTAVIFTGAGGADRYLQKSLGFKGTQTFAKQHGFEFFYWKVRFYQENEPEDYRVNVSAATGEITNFRHNVKENATRPDQGEGTAKQKAISFLQKHFQFDPEHYILQSNLSQKFDNRTDYTFVWEKKDVYVRWNAEPDSGGAKLLTGATISGDEVLVFNKMNLSIPDDFNRDLARKKSVGRNLAILFRIAFFSLLTAAIFYVVVRRNDLVMHTTKKFCIAITAVIFVLNIASFFNEFESVRYHYSSTSSYLSYLWRIITSVLLDTFIVTISILMPCLAGESLHYETMPDKREGGFLHYIQSSVFSRSVAGSVLVGYLIAVIMVGIQALAFEIGQRYLGVWVEYIWMAQLSSSYLPWLAAFILGAVASSTEEIAFRLFSISLGKKFLKRTFLAVFCASVIWGYGHSTYMVFPMWFRGLEVTLLGIFLSYMYLQYGIIAVLVGHFLFDVFWGSAPYLLGQSTPYLFLSALGVLLLPLFWALAAYLRNESDTERTMQWRLNRHQIFNLEVLTYYLKNNFMNKDQPLPDLKKEIMDHGWDIAVVEMALAKSTPAAAGGQTTDAP